MGSMDRRQWMVSALGAAFAATLERQAEAQTSPSAPAGPFTVRANASRGTGPWVLGGKNPVASKVSGADVDQRFSVIEVETPPGRGPEMHIHLAQNEFFFVLQGSIGIQCGTDKFVLKTGDSFMAPMGVPHAYVTLSQQPARILNIFDPAGSMEAYFEKLATIIRPTGLLTRRKWKRTMRNTA